MLKIFVVQWHPRNIFNIELFPNYGIIDFKAYKIGGLGFQALKEVWRSEKKFLNEPNNTFSSFVATWLFQQC